MSSVAVDTINQVIPREKFIYPALPVTIHDGSECAGQIGLRIDIIEFAGLDERGTDGPVLSPGIVPGKERVLPIEGKG